MSKLRTITACIRARSKTRLRARCIVRVALTEQVVNETRAVLNRLQVKRPL